MKSEDTMTGGRIATLDCHIRGIVPCIMANGAMADPTYHWAKQAREIKKGVKRGEVMTEKQANDYYYALPGSNSWRAFSFFVPTPPMLQPCNFARFIPLTP
jgi:hypothetical protein